MKVEAGDWQLKHVSRLEILQDSESSPQYLAPHCGQPTTLPVIGLRHCQQIAEVLLPSVCVATAGRGDWAIAGIGCGWGILC